jgi:hypothetical protein
MMSSNSRARVPATGYQRSKITMSQSAYGVSAAPGTRPGGGAGHVPCGSKKSISGGSNSVRARYVRLHPAIHPHTRASSGVGTAHEFGDEFTPGEQRFSAVQDKRHAGYLVTAGMLTDAHRGTAGDLRRHPARAVPPGLIGHLVHVAVVAC